MWNDIHSALLSKLILGTDRLKRTQDTLTKDGHSVLNQNSACLYFRELIDSPEIKSQSQLDSVHNACKFLFCEFGDIWTNANRRHPTFPIIGDKVHTFGFENAGYDCFSEVYGQHLSAKGLLALRGGIDCLFVTALPTEFLAIVRRMDYFIEGTDPDTTRGFADSRKSEERLPPGWILGGITRGRQSISVAVVCASIYGPHGASSAVAKFFSARQWTPRHIIVVGIGASLGSKSTFALGDVAYSTGIDDITLPKYGVSGSPVPDIKLLSEVNVTSAPNWSVVPDELQYPVLRLKGNKLILDGILEKRHVRLLQDAFARRRDKNKIRELFMESQRKAEATDFQSNFRERPCPDCMVQKAQDVANQDKWRIGIQLRPPKGESSPRVIHTRVLSGSAVVKAYGVRSYLKKKFKRRLLLEMEGAGVATYCTDNGIANPIVIKSACDWATPGKEKSWQSYCADVAASFAVEVALELA